MKLSKLKAIIDKVIETEGDLDIILPGVDITKKIGNDRTRKIMSIKTYNDTPFTRQAILSANNRKVRGEKHTENIYEEDKV